MLRPLLVCAFLACLSALLALRQEWFAYLAVGFIVALLIAAGRAVCESTSRLQRETSRTFLLESQLESDRNAVDTLAEGLEIAIFLCDRRSIIEYANPQATEMFRFPSPVGRTVLAVTLSHEIDRLVSACVETGEKLHEELAFAYPDGRTAMAAAWPESGGDRIFVSLYETTDLRRLERVRQDFVANVSHELRTPLTTIRAMAETLQEEPGATNLAERYLAKITDEVDRLSLIANDLLILSVAESNPVRRHACDVAETFRSVVQQLENIARQKGLTLSCVGPDSLMIEANGAQINQVAINLLDNAINYTVEGSVIAKISQEGDQVVIEVSDTGMGISSEHQSKIFERFYRVGKGRARATGGTGLGLSIVKHIVEAHGGSVDVVSNLNQGSSFFVRLPVGQLADQHSDR